MLPSGPIDEAESLGDVGVDSRDLFSAADAPSHDADLHEGLLTVGGLHASRADQGATTIT